MVPIGRKKGTFQEKMCKAGRKKGKKEVFHDRVGGSFRVTGSCYGFLSLGHREPMLTATEGRKPTKFLADTGGDDQINP